MLQPKVVRAALEINYSFGTRAILLPPEVFRFAMIQASRVG